MSEKCLCPCCGQPLPPRQRAGVWLPAKKAEIFDFINKHPGVTAEGIAAQCYPDGEDKINLVRSHIHQINCMLAATDTRISGNEPKSRGEYQVIREEA
jgi:hypothetical protein